VHRFLFWHLKKQGWSNGCWQEFLCIEETELLPIPDGINPFHVFDFFNTPLTAYVMTVKNIKPRQGANFTPHRSRIHSRKNDS
jgi:NADPH:quinone reductase-like Zn-dependent oxidoreductase